MKTRKIMAWFGGVLLCAAVIFFLLYRFFLSDPITRFQRSGNVSVLLSDTKVLQEKVAKHPDDLSTHLKLAKIYKIMGKYPDAIKAFGKAWPLVSHSPSDLVDFADVLSRQKGESFAGKPLDLINQALTIDANNVDALILKGTAELQQRNLMRAIKNWEKAYRVLPDKDPRKSELLNMITQAKNQLGK